MAPIAIEIVVNALRDHLQYPRIAYYAALGKYNSYLKSPM